MLQNRVTPLGQLIKTPARGAWMGNRGLIHDAQQNIRREFRLKAWITCKLEFKGWHRPVMAPGQYTELFFLDEATAFSAGHRPCAECRRDAFNQFKSLWLQGNAEYGFDMKTKIGFIDDIIHNERMNSDGSKKMHEENTDQLPDGTFILVNDKPWLVLNGMMHEWGPEGYQKGISLPQQKKVMLLTPASVVNAFRAGYHPQISLNH